MVESLLDIALRPLNWIYHAYLVIQILTLFFQAASVLAVSWYQKLMEDHHEVELKTNPSGFSKILSHR